MSFHHILQKLKNTYRRSKRVNLRTLWYDCLRVSHEHVLSPLGLYAVTEMKEREYMGKVNMKYPHLARKLHKSTHFAKSYISTFKHRVGDERAKSSWVYRKKVTSKHQYHIIIFTGFSEDTLDLYLHKEYNVSRHPIKHYIHNSIPLEEVKEEEYLEIKGELAKVGINVNDEVYPEYNAETAYCPITF